MSHGSEDANPDLADVVYQFRGMAIEAVFRMRDDNLTLRDYQYIRATARMVIEEAERAIEVNTPIDLTREDGECTCPPLKWQSTDSPRVHMLRCPLFRPGPI